ncbi:MAG TPA: GNAT family N-acetyltransferase [Candidatus Cybelea sp.]|nr:GNAT family N-acetyltransferase [Candidatus Cybelea sp.]
MPIIGVELVSDRLRLRPPGAADAEPIAAQVNDWDVVRYTTSIPFPYDRSMAEAFVASQARRWAAWSPETAPKEELTFAIERSADQRLIGCIGLQPAESGDGVEFGYWLGRAYWGLGYATEAVQRLTRFTFEELSVPEIWAAAVPINDASQRVLEKCGFAIVTAGERESEVRGHALPVVVRRLSRAQWAGAAKASA